MLSGLYGLHGLFSFIVTGSNGFCGGEGLTVAGNASRVKAGSASRNQWHLIDEQPRVLERGAVTGVRVQDQLCDRNVSQRMWELIVGNMMS